MAFSGDNGNPVAFGTGQSGSDDRSLFLKMFSGEVLTSFTAATVTKGKVREKNITSGKSYQFPKTGTSTAEYLARGQEMLGNPFATGEVEVTVDAPMVAHHALWDFDVAMSQFDVRGPMTADMGQALARVYDQNNFRQIALSARTAAVGPFPGGQKIVNAGLLGSGAIDGTVWLNQIRQAKLGLQAKNIPQGIPLYMAVSPAVFDAIKYARDATSGQYLNLQSQIQLATAGVGSAVTEGIRFEGVSIFPSNLLPNANDTANTAVYSKYRADFSKTTGLMWATDAVAVLTLMGISTETFRDVRRQEDFIVSKQAVGHGTLRPELAVEFATA
ncbi:phage capsid protein [Caballeronia sp. LZ033]|uniref:phage capsid protein n=1 Tax=Caballeronia sp. LZ033 TaxID=3038566 RepID=UPI0028570564|nr:phage capsid protein [Caballeronia sp. LZ033]MDR5812011.1 phage capsid protein [Caballeronia sp. LZ033]